MALRRIARLPRWVGNDSQATLILPVLINLILFVFLAIDFIRRPSSSVSPGCEPDLPASGVAYAQGDAGMARVFLLNGLLALITAVIGNVELWSLYNGFIAYLLMGLLFAGEFLVRRQVRAQ